MTVFLNSSEIQIYTHTKKKTQTNPTYYSRSEKVSQRKERQATIIEHKISFSTDFVKEILGFKYSWEMCNFRNNQYSKFLIL